MIQRILQTATRKPIFSTFRPFNFSTSVDRSRFLKICSLLKIKYMPCNEEIGSGILIRLIEEETGTFLGIKNISEAMFDHKQKSRITRFGRCANERQIDSGHLQDFELQEVPLPEVHQRVHHEKRGSEWANKTNHSAEGPRPRICSFGSGQTSRRTTFRSNCKN